MNIVFERRLNYPVLILAVIINFLASQSWPELFGLASLAAFYLMSSTNSNPKDKNKIVVVLIWVICGGLSIYSAGYFLITRILSL